MNTEINEMLKKPWNHSWPLEDLESVPHCPVCGENKRAILHADLVDNVFRVAPGKWTLWQCSNCNSAYLDPRPTEVSIGQAYKKYFTHNLTMKEKAGELGRFRLFRRALANGYLNHRYNTQYKPASRFGTLFAGLLPSQRDALDVQFRWLPKAKSGQRLLDVGFGSGGFLRNATTAGWNAEGVDPDQTAVANARELKQNVRQGGIDVYSDELENFDAITISHVIEHVHDPVVVLKQAFELLKPGGVLYLDTPNIESHGHRRFQRNWLHLDSPRHLVIFSRKSLVDLLHTTGFDDIQLIECPNVSVGSYVSSLRIESGHDPFAQISPNPRWKSRFFSLRARIDKSGVEFFTLLARKKEL